MSAGRATSSGHFQISFPEKLFCQDMSGNDSLREMKNTPQMSGTGQSADLTYDIADSWTPQIRPRRPDSMTLT